MPEPYNELNVLVWAGYALAAVALIETLVMATHIAVMRQRGRSPLPFVLPLTLSGIVTVGVISGAIWTGARNQTLRDTLLMLASHSYPPHFVDSLLSSAAQVARVALIWEGAAVIIMAVLAAHWLLLSKRRRQRPGASQWESDAVISANDHSA